MPSPQAKKRKRENKRVIVVDTGDTVKISLPVTEYNYNFLTRRLGFSVNKEIIYKLDDMMYRTYTKRVME